MSETDQKPPETEQRSSESDEEKLRRKQNALEEQCIKEGRRTASGKLIKSAEPLQYWEKEADPEG